MPELTDQERRVLASLVSRLTSGTVSPPARRPKVRRHAGPKYLTEDQVNALFASAAGNARDLAIFRLAYHRGLRASEVGRLRLEDYDADSCRLRFTRLKGSTGGRFTLTRHEAAALQTWIAARGDSPGPLFPGRPPTRGISRYQLDYLIKQYGRAAGLPPELCHMHALKHSCGTHLLNRGESIEDIQDHLGHVSISNTLIYAKITNRRREARDARLADW